MHGTGAPLGRYSREVPVEARAAAERVAAVLDRQQDRRQDGPQRVLVLGHAGADGDVCGSSLGLACALRERGADVVVYNEQPYPEAYAWLPGGRDVVCRLDPADRFDVTVVVDAARPDRLGAHFPDAARRGTYVWIDHHRIAEMPGDIGYVDLTAAAVGEQIAEVLDALAHPLSADVARCLYASLMADTGGFRYANTSARALRLAARLVEAGVDPWQMTEHIYESQDEVRVRLLGKALSSLWLSACGRVGVVEIHADDVAALGASDEHVQGLVNHVRGVKGVEVALLFREIPRDGGTRVIVRSRGNVDVAPVASSLGALGHKNAASFHLGAPIKQARALVVDAFLAALPHLSGLSSLAVSGEAREEPRVADKRRARSARRHLRPAE